MKAVEAKLLNFIKKSSQFIIPIYQRTYSWTERECRQLWNDIIRTGSNDAISAHFVGSTSTGSGTTRAIRRAACRASTRKMNWSG